MSRPQTFLPISTCATTSRRYWPKRRCWFTAARGGTTRLARAAGCGASTWTPGCGLRLIHGSRFCNIWDRDWVSVARCSQMCLVVSPTPSLAISLYSYVTRLNDVFMYGSPTFIEPQGASLSTPLRPSFTITVEKKNEIDARRHKHVLVS